MNDYTPPNLADFRARFPGFSGFPDDTVEMVLDEAILECGPTWVNKDRFNATLYLTAHLLWTQEQGVIDPGANGNGGGGGSSSTVTGGQLKRRKVGDVEVEWSVASTSVSAGSGGIGGGSTTASYWQTPYGRRYLELMRRSFPAVRVV
jgi:hypothetical protein